MYVCRLLKTNNLYIYIYIYIMIVIINEYILDIYIYLIHGKYSATLGFMKFFVKQQSSGS